MNHIDLHKAQIRQNVLEMYDIPSSTVSPEIAKAVEEHAMNLFEKGELSQVDLNELLVTGIITDDIRHKSVILGTDQQSKEGIFQYTGLKWEPVKK